jgi:hypothetical protein
MLSDTNLTGAKEGKRGKRGKKERKRMGKREAKKHAWTSRIQ